jgi:CBS domain-containing protein
MKAADIMTTSIITIGPNARVSDVAEKSRDPDH